MWAETLSSPPPASTRNSTASRMGLSPPPSRLSLLFIEFWENTLTEIVYEDYFGDWLESGFFSALTEEKRICCDVYEGVTKMRVRRLQIIVFHRASFTQSKLLAVGCKTFYNNYMQDDSF